MIATDQTSDTSLTADQAAARFESLLTGDGNQVENEEENPEEPSEDAPEEEAEGQDAEDPAEAEDEPQLFTVKVDGKEEKVALDELVKGYQRTADYTRKTQAIAEQRKAAEGELEAAKAERAHYQSNLEKLTAQFQQQAPQEPDWMRLANENPAEYVRQRAIFDHRQQVAQSLEAERQQVAEKQQADDARQLAAHLEAEKSLMLEVIPEWKNEKTAATERKALVEFGLKSGLTSEELSEITDHRIVALLRKAMLHDKLMASKGAIRPVQQQGPRPAVPGTPQARNTSAARARQRFQETGDVKDAAKVFEQFL